MQKSLALKEALVLAVLSVPWGPPGSLTSEPPPRLHGCRQHATTGFLKSDQKSSNRCDGAVL